MPLLPTSIAATPSFQAAALTPDSTYVGFKSMSGQLAQTDPTLLGRTDSKPVNVMINAELMRDGLPQDERGWTQAPNVPGR